MFKKRTVFIVGAGGSKEVGLPTGDELKQLIADNVNIGSTNGFNLTSGSPIISNAFCHRHRTTDPNAFFRSGRIIAAAMPLSASIDNFLDAHSHDPDVILMGKMGIAVSVSQAEKQSKVYKGDIPLERNANSLFTDTWHSTFCKMAWEGLGKSQLGDIFENVSIITFNYDRVIETYVTEALKQYYILHVSEAEEIASSLQIIHVYGQIGGFGRRPGGAMELPFGGELNSNNLFEISEQLSVFTEEYRDKQKLNRIHDLLREADVIVYIGFSFAEMNMKLLAINGAPGSKFVFGTSLGISEANTSVIRNQIISSLKVGTSISVTLSSEGGKSFLQNHWMPIMY